MPTRNVVLSDHQQELVETLVQSGRYQNASEVLREGLRLIEERERIEAEKASRSGPALEQLRTRQAALGRREDELRGLLASEQDRLTQLKRLIAEADAPARR